ncbi:MAG: hypothetical protein QRY71_01665 [Candidatus Rhabdochlamydia sp.]
MLIKNTLHFVGKRESFFLPKRQSIGSFIASFSSVPTKVADIASLKLNSKTPLNASQIHNISLHEAGGLIGSYPKIQLKGVHQGNKPQKLIKKDVSWLKPFVIKGVIDAEAERKFSASFDEGWVSNPLDFIHLDLEKASCGDLADLIPLLNREILKPETEEGLMKKLRDQTKAELALQYANPELDHLIELNQGRIENIEDFDMYQLQHRANIGVLDKETARKAYDRVYVYEEQRMKEYLEEEDFSDYSEYCGLALEKESDYFSEK